MLNEKKIENNNCVVVGIQKPPTKRRATKPITISYEEKFYKELKESVYLSEHGTIDDSLPEDTDSIVRQLDEFQANLKTHKKKENYIKCLMGRNLLKIKDSTKLKGEKFVKHAKTLLPRSYERSEIYFMMNLHSLAETYNRLMYVTMGTGRLKSNLKLITKLLKDNAEYWKSV